MIKFWMLILILLTFSSCSRSPLSTGVKAEENRYNLSWVETGMSQSQVLCRVGGPQRIEKKAINGVCYEIWYYLTKRYGLGQSRLLLQNTTPLIFRNKRLIGWGREYYNYLLNINNERGKRKSEEKFEYTDDENEWPLNQHSTVPEPPPQEPLPIEVPKQ